MYKLQKFTVLFGTHRGQRITQLVENAQKAVVTMLMKYVPNLRHMYKLQKFTVYSEMYAAVPRVHVYMVLTSTHKVRIVVYFYKRYGRGHRIVQRSGVCSVVPTLTLTLM